MACEPFREDEEARIAREDNEMFIRLSMEGSLIHDKSLAELDARSARCEVVCGTICEVAACVVPDEEPLSTKAEVNPLIDTACGDMVEVLESIEEVATMVPGDPAENLRSEYPNPTLK